MLGQMLLILMILKAMDWSVATYLGVLADPLNHILFSINAYNKFFHPIDDVLIWCIELSSVTQNGDAKIKCIHMFLHKNKIHRRFYPNPFMNLDNILKLCIRTWHSMEGK